MITPEVTGLFVDFESFYSTEYSLRKISPAEYILDPRFEAICLGVAGMTGDPLIIEGPDIPLFIHKIEQHRRDTNRPIVMISHNAQFDMAVMSWRYDFHPDMIIDTIAMSRTVLGPRLVSHSLDSVAQHFNLPAKGSLIKEVKGMTRLDIMSAGLWDREVEYCLHDVWLCREIYNRLFPVMPSDEFVLHDIITRCTTEPLLRVDKVLLERYLLMIQELKAAALAQVKAMGVTKADLMSNPKLADVLRMLGVEPPMKTSPRTHEQTYAFAKSDEEFLELREHPNVMVRSVVEARLETKSTIEETRTQRFLKIADLDFPGQGKGIMPMPVIIGAAHTHRFGGGWDLNVQNLGRDSTLRNAIYCDDGYVLLVADAKQIEARVTAEFCGQTDLVEEFRRGEDVYANFASTVFGRSISSKDKLERFLGKTGILQLGYACGWAKFQHTVTVQSAKTDTPIELTDEQAIDIVNKYRGRFSRIKGMWRELDYILGMMHSLNNVEDGGGLTKKCVTFYKDVMLGPTGLPIHFPNLHYVEEPDGMGSWWFRDGRFQRRTYGASLLETIAQHLSRCIVMSAAVRLRNPMQGLGARLVHTAHDELVYRVPVDNVESAKIWAELEMNRPPVWLPNVPLACDIGIGQRYGEAKS
jgi:DNA polymerase family A/3'-5' exonuclease